MELENDKLTSEIPWLSFTKNTPQLPIIMQRVKTVFLRILDTIIIATSIPIFRGIERM